MTPRRASRGTSPAGGWGTLFARLGGSPPGPRTARNPEDRALEDAVTAMPQKTELRFRALALAGIVALGALLRWIHIGEGSMWIDEAGSVTLARLPLDRFLRTLWQYEANMAFYYGVLRAWIHLGDSESVLRSFSALCGTAAVAALYDLGRRLRGVRAGLVAAALLSVNMFHIWFSQETRSYSLTVLLLVLSLRFFVEGIEDPRKA